MKQTLRDRLDVLFMGRQYADDDLRMCESDIRWALDTDAYCPNCEGIDACVLPVKGYMMFFNHADAGRFKLPRFGVAFCQYLKQQQAELSEADQVDHYKGADFNRLKVTDDNKTAFNRCRQYAMTINKQTKKGLLLIGNEGTGKTSLAYAVMRQANRAGLPCAFIVVSNVLDDLRQNYKNDFYEPTTYFRAKEKHFVILDDLGVEKPTDWVREQIYKLINERYMKGLPTLITTNFTLQELEERLGSDDIVVGKRITGRICEMCDIVPVTGKSWRRKK